MIAYFDTSSFANLVLRDAGWDTIATWLAATQPQPCLSDFGWGEFVSAVALRVRSSGLSGDAAQKTIEATHRYRRDWHIVRIDPVDIGAATKLVERFDLGLRLPDAIHVALAQRLGHMLVTTDRQQAHAARAIGVDVFNPLKGPLSS